MGDGGVDHGVGKGAWDGVRQGVAIHFSHNN